MLHFVFSNDDPLRKKKIINGFLLTIIPNLLILDTILEREGGGRGGSGGGGGAGGDGGEENPWQTQSLLILETIMNCLTRL